MSVETMSRRRILTRSKMKRAVCERKEMTEIVLPEDDNKNKFI